MDKNMLSGVCGNGFARVIAIDSKEIVSEALRIHNLSPVACAALGRLITGASLMSNHLKNDTDSVTLQVKCDGPIGGLVAVSDAHGNVRGYCVNPYADLPLRETDGKLDVGGVVGKGYLNVIKDIGLKEPYGGTVELVSGEIAEDISYYYMTSEQIPSIVALGVLVFPSDNERGFAVQAAGGYMVQLLPGAPDSLIDELESRISGFLPVTTLLNAGASIVNVCEDLLHGLDFQIQKQTYAGYKCNCSTERITAALKSIGREALTKIADEDRHAEMVCHFCKKKYQFSEEELRLLAIGD